LQQTGRSAGHGEPSHTSVTAAGALLAIAVAVAVAGAGAAETLAEAWIAGGELPGPAGVPHAPRRIGAEREARTRDALQV
jgi:hypothetical protein